VAPQAGPDDREALRGRCVAVVGLGYVGLPTALSLADHGALVFGLDISRPRIVAIAHGEVDLSEHDRHRLQTHLRNRRLRPSTDESVLSAADTVVMCVPTPIDEHMTPDLSALSGACERVVAHAVARQTIILTSTTYVGCTRELLVEPLERRNLRAGREVFVAFSPERIDPGATDHQPELTPRVVGGATAACTESAASLLRRTALQIHKVSSPEAAEMTKLVENTFRAVNVALANEFSVAAATLNIDVMEVIRAASTKPYGFLPHYPGPGVGGHCIPCDPHYLLWQLTGCRTTAPVISAAMIAIATRPRAVVNRARELLGDACRPLRGARILIVGVAYKPGVADLRESPALEIIDDLAAAGGQIGFTDPLVETLTTPHTGELKVERVPSAGAWDLVIAHTPDPAADHTWMRGCSLVLDASYRLDQLPHRHLL
jgi:nucleotide sugar dehydrogenase